MTAIHRYWSGESPPPLGRWGARAARAADPDAELNDWTDETLPVWATLDHAGRSVAHHLSILIGHHRDVKVEPRVIPHDTTGARTARSEAWAVHLWSTSGRRYEGSSA